MESNRKQQIRNNKNRTIVRPKTFALICYLTWQGFQFVKITLPELEKIDVAEIHELLGQSNVSKQEDILYL